MMFVGTGDFVPLGHLCVDPLEIRAMECSMFKSPVAKLLKFFPQSRDRWKAKCQQAKRDNKKLANQVRAVERSRTHWKQIAKEAQQALAQSQRECEELKNHAAAECG